MAKKHPQKADKSVDKRNFEVFVFHHPNIKKIFAYNGYKYKVVLF
jgi:hypothetical protein